MGGGVVWVGGGGVRGVGDVGVPSCSPLGSQFSFDFWELCLLGKGSGASVTPLTPGW